MYSQVEDVQRFIKWFTFEEDSKPLNTSDVNHFIKESDSKIDAMLRRVYEVPVIDDSDKELVGFISARLTAYTTAKILVGQAGGDIPDTIQEAKNQAEERLDDLLTLRLLLENTPFKIRSGSSLYSHTAHDPKAPSIKWEREKEQW